MMDYRIFHVGTDFNACTCTQGYTDTVRDSALTVDSGEKVPAAPENWTYVSSMPVQRANMSYIPTHPFVLHGEEAECSGELNLHQQHAGPTR